MTHLETVRNHERKPSAMMERKGRLRSEGKKEQERSW
jgi:hypothetical protein